MRRRWLLAVAVIGTLGSIGCSNIVGTGPQAQAILRVNREQSGNASDFMIYKETQAAMLKSNLVITAALRSNNVPNIKASVDEVRRSLTVQAAEDELITLSLASGTWDERGAAVHLLNAIIDAYLEEVVNSERLDLGDQLASLRSRYRQMTTGTESKARALVELEQASENQHAVPLESKLQLLNSKLIELQLQRVEEQENDASEEKLATTQAKIDFINQEIRTHNEQLAKRKTSAARITAEEELLANDREQAAKVLQAINDLELELSGPSRVSAIQRAVVTKKR